MLISTTITTNFIAFKWHCTSSSSSSSLSVCRQVCCVVTRCPSKACNNLVSSRSLALSLSHLFYCFSFHSSCLPKSGQTVLGRSESRRWKRIVAVVRATSFSTSAHYLYSSAVQLQFGLITFLYNGVCVCVIKQCASTDCDAAGHHCRQAWLVSSSSSPSSSSASSAASSTKVLAACWWPHRGDTSTGDSAYQRRCEPHQQCWWWKWPRWQKPKH